MGGEGGERAVLDFYGERWREFGYDTCSLGIGSRASQEAQFRILAEVGDLRGGSVLDVGCGFGKLSFPHNQRGDSVDPSCPCARGHLDGLSFSEGIDMPFRVCTPLMYREPSALFSRGINGLDLPLTNAPQEFQRVEETHPG